MKTDRLPLVILALSLAGCGIDFFGLGAAGKADLIELSEIRELVPGQVVTYDVKVLDGDATELPDEFVLWSSSDTRIATVTQRGVVTALRPGTFTLTAEYQNKEQKVPVTVHQGGMAGPDSGQIFSTDGTFWITHFAGSIRELSPITLLPLAVNPGNASVVPGTGWGLRLGGIGFTDKAMLITMRYDPARLPAGANPLHLQIRRNDGTVIARSAVDTAEHTVSLLTREIVVAMAMIEVPLPAISLPAPFTMQRNGQQTIVATPIDPLKGFTIAWESSDPTIVSVNVVNGEGELHALRGGTVTIRIKVAELEASTTVTVQP